MTVPVTYCDFCQEQIKQQALFKLTLTDSEEKTIDLTWNFDYASGPRDICRKCFNNLVKQPIE
jgi:hypothetical protein